MALAICLAMGDAERGFTGGRPSTVVTWQETSPFALGRLLAYYEHITAVSGWLLNLNSFDQPGVELGKVIARQYEDYMDNGSGGDHIPTISRHILDHYRS